MKNNIKCIIFDIGKVLIPSPDPYIGDGVRSAFGISQETFDREWNMLTPRLVTGAISPDEFWSAFATAVKVPLPENYLRLHTDPLDTTIDPLLETLVFKLKKAGYFVAVFSDTILPHAEKLRASGLYDMFDAAILSHEIGASKKTKEAFHIALERLGFKPGECIFIDDRPDYIANAKSVGIHGIHYKEYGPLLKDLKAHGVSLTP